MSSENAALIAVFNIARAHNNRYFTVVIFIIGVLGNCLNVLVLSQPVLNQVPTARYFLAASGASLASLTSGLLARIMSGWTADPASYNRSLCKFQAYTNKLGQTCCSYFILAAAIDRWFQSCQNIRYRQMSSIKNSTRAITIILIVFGIYHSIHAICYEAFQTIPPIKCYAGSKTCRYFENISYALITVIIPHCSILFAGWKTIESIRYSRRRVNVSVFHNSVFTTNIAPSITRCMRNQITDQAKMRSLTRMLIVQVCTYIILTLPAAGEALYMTITLEKKGSVDTDLQLAIDRFLFAFTAVLSYMAISLPFFLYTLTGSTFRKILIKIVTKKRCCSVDH
ncbi:unnamed protein product [Rotaria sp. Silwood2]|nr:unnamed protein product [Rotaria sp. Silwood2]CAF4581243.1 unnamed protein product [Rotaria sp. Silwood2]